MSVTIHLCLTPPVRGETTLCGQHLPGCQEILLDYRRGWEGTLQALLEAIPLEMTALRAGEAAALAALERYLDCLAEGLVSYIHVLDPETIYLSGGPCALGERFFAPLRRRVGELCFFSEFAQILPGEVPHA